MSRDRSSARCSVSGIGVSAMPVVLLYDGRLHVFDVRTAFADLLGYRLIAVDVFLPFEGREVLANRILKFLTGSAQLPVSTPQHACHFWQPLRPQDDQRDRQNHDQFWEPNTEHSCLLTLCAGSIPDCLPTVECTMGTVIPRQARKVLTDGVVDIQVCFWKATRPV